jgi:hypothetical protein
MSWLRAGLMTEQLAGKKRPRFFDPSPEEQAPSEEQEEKFEIVPSEIENFEKRQQDDELIIKNQEKEEDVYYFQPPFLGYMLSA